MPPGVALAPVGGALVLRPEVRSATLRLLEQEDAAFVRGIDGRAAAWYASRDLADPTNAAELVYHRLRLGDTDAAAAAWRMECANLLLRAEEELKRAQLWDKANSMSRTLSGGMKRRLMIARAMMTRPRLLILDEPTAGVDIEIRRGMWKTLKDINAAGTTIILTTHYLEEAESLCRNVAIIDRGTIVEQGPMRDLLAKLDVEGFIFDIDGELPVQLPVIEGTTLTATDATTLDLDMPRAMDLNRVFAALGDAGIRVRSMRTKSNRLEELFVRLTGDEAAAKREQAA